MQTQIIKPTGLALDTAAFSGHYVEDSRIPEVSARIKVIDAALRKSGILDATLPITVPIAGKDPASREDRKRILALVRQHHDRAYVTNFKYACEKRYLIMSGSNDAAISRGSFDAAWRAAGTVLNAVDMVMAGQVRNAFCAVRPPGHHALPDRAMGFCFFNNVGVAARYLLEKHQLSKVLILDWDLHHGNGAQASFWDEPRVLFCSMHGDPAELRFPGTGSETEAGECDNILNIPLRAGTESEAYQRAFLERFLPRAYTFRPEFILISAGFDTHRLDPFQFMFLETGVYGWMTKEVKRLAATCCNGRIVSMLEGGYNLEVLGGCVAAHVEALRDGTI